MSLAAKTLLLALAVAGVHAYGEVRSASQRFRRISHSLGDDDIKGGEPPLSKDDGGTTEDPDEDVSAKFRDASMTATQPDVVTWKDFKPVISKNLNKAPVTKADFTFYSNRGIRFGIAQVDEHPVMKTRMNQPWFYVGVQWLTSKGALNGGGIMSDYAAPCSHFVEKKGAGDEAKCGAHSPHCLCVPIHLTDVPGHALSAHSRAATMKIDTYLRLKFRTAAGVKQLQERINMLRALWAQDSGLSMADALTAVFSNGATHQGHSSYLEVDGSLKTFSCALAAAADGCNVMDNLVAEVVAHFVVKGGDAHVDTKDIIKGLDTYRTWADSGKKKLWHQDRSADCFHDWDAMITKLKAQTALPICEAFWKTHIATDGKCVSNQGDNYKKGSQLDHCRDNAGQPDTAWLKDIEFNYRRLLDSNGFTPFTGCPFKQREMEVKSALACGLDWE